MSISRRNMLIGGAAIGAAGLTVAMTSMASAGTELDAAVEALRIAMLNADEKMLNELVSDEVSFGHSSGLIQTKAEFISNLVRQVEVFHTLDLSKRESKIAGEVALERHQFDADLVFSGKRLTVSLGVLQTWKKEEDGRWRLFARQAFKV